MRIGFIGLGNMGSGMAASLLSAGHEVTAYNRSPDKIAALAELGATTAPTVAAACDGDIVITMLADDAAMEALTFGDSGSPGILTSLRPGATHVSSSTVSVALAGVRRNRAAHLCGLGGAQGRQPDQAVRELPDRLGDRIAGRGNGSGQQGRRRQAVLSGHPDVDVVRRAVYKTYGGLLARDEFEPAGFAAHLGLKDVRLVLAAAEQIEVALPIASLLRDRFLTLLAGGGAELDWSAVGALAAAHAGGPGLEVAIRRLDAILNPSEGRRVVAVVGRVVGGRNKPSR